MKEEYREDGINIRDTVRAVVVCSCSKGIILELEDGEPAFAYFGSLCPGTEVLCTVRKLAREGLRALVAIDSVLRSCTEAGVMAA